MGFFDRLKQGLTKTRAGLVNSVNRVFSTYDVIDEDFFEELEEVLILSDVGVETTDLLLEDLRTKVKEEGLTSAAACREVLFDSMKERMAVSPDDYHFEETASILLVIGVNGVGKTTTVGKLASIYATQGKQVILGAADTFRAAAGEQLKIWATRANVPLIGGAEGADPSSVVYDAISSFNAKQADLLIIDTAGRLNNKKNLMQELGKIYRTVERNAPDAYLETLLVVDATTGQNALMQAKEFSEIAPISGIIITKLDGTAKGGIAIAIQSELSIPVKFIGIGETIEDLQKFDPDAFVDAIFTHEEYENNDDPGTL